MTQRIPERITPLLYGEIRDKIKTVQYNNKIIITQNKR